MSTHRQNITDRYCPRGHRQTPENIYVRPDTGAEICAICKSIDAKRRYDEGKQRAVRKIAAEMRSQDRHGPELVRVPVAGWGCRP